MRGHEHTMRECDITMRQHENTMQKLLTIITLSLRDIATSQRSFAFSHRLIIVSLSALYWQSYESSTQIREDTMLKLGSQSLIYCLPIVFVYKNYT